MQKFGEGLIGIADCIIPELQKCIEMICNFKNCFDEFFLEIQSGFSEKQKAINDTVVQLAIETSTPIIVTNDIRYLNQEDRQVYDVHSKLTQNTNLKENDSLYSLTDITIFALRKFKNVNPI